MPPLEAMRKGNLFIVSGPSGAGKGTLVRALLDRVSDVWLSISATTREPRPGEIEGVHYFFLSSDEFDRRVNDGGFLEWAQVHGNRYGTLREPVEAQMERGNQVLLEIDPQGAMQVKRHMPEAVLVFIEAPSVDELRHRLATRGSETSQQIETRMQTAMRELELAGMYDFVITNDVVPRAERELEAIIESYAAPASDTTKD